MNYRYDPRIVKTHTPGNRWMKDRRRCRADVLPEAQGMPLLLLRRCSRVWFTAFTAAVLGSSQGCETVRPAASGSQSADAISGAPPGVAATVAPGKYATRRGYYVLYHDFEIDTSHALLEELDALPEQVFGELNLPPTTAVVQVFLFDTKQRYERFIHAKHPDLPPRRAYFLSQPRAGGPDELKIYTWMGDHIATDLRHELTHALLRSVLKDVPLWLDEGLAGYFELPPDQKGVNWQHLETLRASPFKPDLARLERLTEVVQMQKPEYREAWLWVHLMLRGDPVVKKVLHDYLQALRTDPKPGPLLPRLKAVVPDPDQALMVHLSKLEGSKPRQPSGG